MTGGAVERKGIGMNDYETEGAGAEHIFVTSSFLGTGFEELRSWLEDFGGQGGML